MDMRLGRVASPSMLDALELVCRDRGLRGDMQCPEGGVAATLLQSELSLLEEGLNMPERHMGDVWERREEEDWERRVLPCIWSQQSSQTRHSITGETGDSYTDIGKPLGGCRNSRDEVSRRRVVRDEQASQKTPPHLRQWCLRSNMENLMEQPNLSQ